MTKKEVQQRVLRNGKPLPLDEFEWDEKTKTFSSASRYLVLDFLDVSGCTFNTDPGCTFKTDSECTFDTGWGCTFDTGWDCTFDTGSDCTFDTSSDCTFKTGSDCTFDTGERCVVVRRDVYEVIEMDGTKKIKLNSMDAKGYTVVEDEVRETIKIGEAEYDKADVEERLKGIKPVN